MKYPTAASLRAPSCGRWVLILRVAALVEISVRGSVDFRFGKEVMGIICVGFRRERPAGLVQRSSRAEVS
jgi:hypothetical protein